MARVKASFAGVSPRDCEPDAAIYRDALVQAVGEIAKVYDMVTGENGEANTINHTGNGRGCTLGYPLVNQAIERRLGATNSKGVSSSGYIIACPVFVPAAPRAVYELEVDVAQYGPERPMSVRVMDASWAAIATEQTLASVDAVHDRRRYRITIDFGALASGAVFYILVRWRTYLSESNTTGADTDNSILSSWRMYPSLAPVGRDGGWPVVEEAQGNSYPLVDAPSAAQALVVNSTYDEQVDPDAPLDPWVLTRANEALKQLWEYVTGAPVPGNFERYLVDSSTTNPTAARSMAHTRSIFASEARIEMPLLAHAFGAIGSGGDSLANPGTFTGLADWYAPIPSSVGGAAATFCRLPCMVPDFSYSAGVHCVMLIAGYNGTPTNWRWRLNGSAWATPVLLAGNFYVVDMSTPVTVSWDAQNEWLLEAYSTAGALGGDREQMPLGACIYFDP